MKTIAVDEETWNTIKKLKAKLDAKSYDQVLRILLETWHTANLGKKIEKISLDDEESEKALDILKKLKEWEE
ncbi:hypothetical protein [Thermococcus sibiricus]|uniref:Ribbon-helix-helix protein CopG domain-containing protein n=1 Tax=Thermococcus sibiricus (strain DSM 12597 / MM 739) TaxID=604354 RepID=C6A194_THESM|nr:hypothetical protein [Thermococcus sibiricus]ACS89389.1 hypothetical protein TSIB_0323 [Thermococcus sibiricus MM 739]